MSSLIILALVLFSYTNACLEERCRCYEKLRVIDCSARQLYSMPHPKSTLENYTSILLRNNHFQHLNFSSLFEVFPRVVLLDLRDNNPLLCHNIMRFQPPKPIRIVSDCNPLTNIPTYYTSATPATRKTKTPRHNPSLYNFKSSISRNFTTHLTTQISRMETSQISRTETSNQVITYIYTLIATLLILPSTIILSRLIIRCWKSRQRSPSVMLHLLPLKIEGDEEDNQSEEDVIFTRATCTTEL